MIRSMPLLTVCLDTMMHAGDTAPSTETASSCWSGPDVAGCRGIIDIQLEHAASIHSRSAATKDAAHATLLPPRPEPDDPARGTILEICQSHVARRYGATIIPASGPSGKPSGLSVLRWPVHCMCMPRDRRSPQCCCWQMALVQGPLDGLEHYRVLGLEVDAKSEDVKQVCIVSTRAWTDMHFEHLCLCPNITALSDGAIPYQSIYRVHAPHTQAFRLLARRLHPDKGGSTEAFAAIQTAFEVLSDPRKRAVYDAYARDVRLRKGVAAEYQVGSEMCRQVLILCCWSWPFDH